MAKITIQSGPKKVTREGKNGEYTKVTQQAVLETVSMKIPLDLEIESVETAFPLGVYNWDSEASLKAGKYGPELPRYYNLTPAKA